MSEQYFLVRKLGLGKEVVSLSLVVTEGTSYWCTASVVHRDRAFLGGLLWMRRFGEER